MLIIYRISDAGYKKIKPSFVNNEICLSNASQAFKNEEWIVIADNVSDETLSMIYKYHPRESVECVSVGHGAGTFNLALDKALARHEDEIIYFLENDYLHKPESAQIIREGIGLGHSFVSLYDHPDKYMIPDQGGNPYCIDGSESTRLYLTKSCHWKISNSTTMTFASTVKSLAITKDLIRKHTFGKHPNDFQMFLDLASAGHTLVTSVPGYSTHGETRWLSPLTDWMQVSENKMIEGIKSSPSSHTASRGGRRYPLGSPDYSHVVNHIIRKHNIVASNNTFSLDIGCGDNLRNPFGARSTFGIDNGPSLVRGDAIVSADLSCEKIPFDSGMFDFCTAYDFVEHIPRVQVIRSGLSRRKRTIYPFVQIMNEIHRILVPGGYFLHCTPAFPAKHAFQDPTNVNIVTEDTFPLYFCVIGSKQPWASMYGFTGSFKLVEQVWAGDIWIVCLLQALKD